MKKIYQIVFNFITRKMSYGMAVALSSILWSGLFTIINIIYVSSELSRYFPDFTDEFIVLMCICFISPFMIAGPLHGAFHRLGIPALLPSFRVVNKYIHVDGDLKIQDGLTGETYLSILKAINRLPIVFFYIALIETTVIQCILFAYGFYKNYQVSGHLWMLFSYFWQVINFGGIGFVLAETVTGRMRRACKMKLRELNITHEIKTKSSIKYKMYIIAAIIIQAMFVSNAFSYLGHADIRRVILYLLVYLTIITLMSFITVRTFYRALDDTGMVVENLKERGEGIIYASTIDREIVELASGINAASDTITDYRVNLEKKVEERTKELQAAMEELEAMNDSLTLVNREIEESNARYKTDNKMAANVQAAFLPQKPSQSDEYDIALIFKPMSGVSGDFYDFYQTDGQVNGAGIFDVSGHGISSGLLTLLARSIINRNFNSNHERLGIVMENINNDLIAEIGQAGLYITGILLRFGDGVVEYANSGHPELIYRSGKTKIAGQVIPPGGESIVGPFLGVDMLKEKFKSIKLQFNRGDSLLAFTDGLRETKNLKGEEYNERRIIKSLQDGPGGTAREILDFVMEQFYDFTRKKDNLSDDITAIVIRKK
jgi:serine phosphatase RsbU (regulator of sigma subunit)